jgi:hypothetical protein
MPLRRIGDKSAIAELAAALYQTFLPRSSVNVMFLPLPESTADRGLRWEMHIDETSFALWTIEGFRPPTRGAPAAKQWQTDTRLSPYSS